jgi:hypothetical protein
VSLARNVGSLSPYSVTGLSLVHCFGDNVSCV